MLSSIVSTALNQRIVVVVVALIALAFGIDATQKLSVDAFPDVTNVQVQVASEARGRSPEEVERFVTGLPTTASARHRWRTVVSVYAPGPHARAAAAALLGLAVPSSPFVSSAGAAAAGTTVAAAPVQPAPAVPAPPRSVAPATYQAPAYEGPQDGLHLVVYPSLRFFDGRTADRPWLLELPDPVAKVSWDSFVEIHPATAERLDITQGDELEITSPHGSIKTRAYLYPGVVRDTLAIQMGLGQEGGGRWTEGLGANPMKLLGSLDPATGSANHAGVRVSVRKTGERNVRRAFPQGLVETGVRVQHDRAIAKAIGLTELIRKDQAGPGIIPGEDQHIEELKGSGGFVPEKMQTDPAAGYPPPGTEYGEYIDGDTRWGMVIDLARCIGCGACQVACSAENNVPVVGPTEVRKGREMWWLRIERYFGVSRHPEEALRDNATDDVRFLPMLCQHCGQAPCEPVCPVYAAYHTPDGLNGQVYNRCVGTRYCAQNCPWKVRVFNWFTYEFAEPLNWQLNPDVTVREKGVMEKCTFCVQRIHETERNAAAEMRPVRDGVLSARAEGYTVLFGDVALQPGEALFEAVNAFVRHGAF